MKLPIRILTALLCAAIILFMPFVLSSPQILDNEKRFLPPPRNGVQSTSAACFSRRLMRKAARTARKRAKK